MAKFVIISDLHCCDKPPKSRTDDYLSTILGKVDWAVEYAIKYDAYMLIIGDFCHRKKPRDVSHFIVNKLLDILSKLKSKGTFGILGNHDIYSIQDDPQRSPITTLVKSGVIKLLDKKPVNINNEVSLNGLSWSKEAETEPAQLQLSHFDSLVKISLFHQYVIPDSIPFAGPHTKLSNAIPFLPGVSIFGHFHDGFPGGILKFGSKFCVNPGALARERATKSNLTRTIQLGFLVVDSGEIRYNNITVPHQPAKIVFDLSRREATVINENRVKQFVAQFSKEVDRIGDADLSSIEELKTLIEQLNLEDSLKTETIKVLVEENWKQ